MPITFDKPASRPISIQDAKSSAIDQVKEGANAAQLEKLFKGFSPAQQLEIASAVHTALEHASSSDRGDATELRNLAKSMERFGQFVLEKQSSGEMTRTHHAMWSNFGNEQERIANTLQDRPAEDGVRTT